MRSFRLKEMEDYILERGTATMEELMNTFQISMNTVRLDVAQLVTKGTIKKVYGGVCGVLKSSLIPFEERQNKNIQRKKAAGEEAAKLVEDGDIIYIDSGTTTMFMMDYLSDRTNVTVLTNNLNAINRGVQLPDINIICLPGMLERKTNSFVSSDAVHILEKYNIHKAFMASSGISENGTITNSSPLEFEIKKAAIINSREVYLVIDSTKYGKSALLTYASITDVSKVIVDKDADPKLLELCRQYGVEAKLAQLAD